MTKKGFILGIFIPLFFILVSSNVIGSVYYGTSDDILQKMTYEGQTPSGLENWNVDTSDYGQVLEVEVADDIDMVFLRTDVSGGSNPVASYIHGINKTTGETIWTMKYAMPESSSDIRYANTMTYDDGRLYRVRQEETFDIYTHFIREINPLNGSVIHDFDNINTDEFGENFEMNLHGDILVTRQDDNFTIYDDNEYVTSENLSGLANFDGAFTSVQENSTQINIYGMRGGFSNIQIVEEFFYDIENEQFSDGAYFWTTISEYKLANTLDVYDDYIYIGIAYQDTDYSLDTPEFVRMDRTPTSGGERIDEEGEFFYLPLEYGDQSVDDEFKLMDFDPYKSLKTDDAGNIYFNTRLQEDSVIAKVNPELNLEWAYNPTFDNEDDGINDVNVQGTKFNYFFRDTSPVDLELNLEVGGVASWESEVKDGNDVIVDTNMTDDLFFYGDVLELGLEYDKEYTWDINYSYDNQTYEQESVNIEIPERPLPPLPEFYNYEPEFDEDNETYTFRVSLIDWTSLMPYPKYLYDWDLDEPDCETYNGEEHCGALTEVTLVIDGLGEFELEPLIVDEGELDIEGGWDGFFYDHQLELEDNVSYIGNRSFVYLANEGVIEDISTDTHNEYYYEVRFYDENTDSFIDVQSDSYYITEPFEGRADWGAYWEIIRDIPSDMGADDWSGGFKALIVIISLFVSSLLVLAFTRNNDLEQLFKPLLFTIIITLILYFTASGVIPFWVFLLILFIGGYILYKRLQYGGLH